jgi:hypothetical protein
VVGGEVLRPLGDPREIAHAQLLLAAKGAGEAEANGVAERSEALGEKLGAHGVQAGVAEGQAVWPIEVQQLSVGVGHTYILIYIDMLAR